MSFYFPGEKESLKGEILFGYEDIEFILESAESYIQWIKLIIEEEEQALDQINYIFCSDQYLHQINVKHLDHDNFTDIITFPFSDEHIESDIYISIDRIRENAKTFDTTFENELRRVMIHGVLHLCGYGDKTDSEKEIMRHKETEAILKFEHKD